MDYLYKELCNEINKSKFIDSFKNSKYKLTVNYYVNPRRSISPVIGFFYKDKEIYAASVFTDKEDCALPYFAKKKKLKDIFKFILKKVERKLKELK